MKTIIMIETIILARNNLFFEILVKEIDFTIEVALNSWIVPDVKNKIIIVIEIVIDVETIIPTGKTLPMMIINKNGKLKVK